MSGGYHRLLKLAPSSVGELLCAPKKPSHYYPPDELSWDEWRLSDREVEGIDLQNTANHEEADEL